MTGSATPDPRRFASCVRVYYEDTDAGGIVYHTSWLRWMERVRTDWLRTLGVEHTGLARRDGLQFVVADLAIRYRRPARLDEMVRVDLEVRDVRRASLRLSQRAWRLDDDVRMDTAAPLVDADVRVAAIRRDDGRPVPLPTGLYDLLGRE